MTNLTPGRTEEAANRRGGSSGGSGATTGTGAGAAGGAESQPTQVDCWACGTRVQVPIVDGHLAPDFKCGWCGAITQSRQRAAGHKGSKKASGCCKQLGSLCGWMERAFDNSFCGAVLWVFQWITVVIVLALITSIMAFGVTFVLPRLQWRPLHALLAFVFSFNIYFNYYMTVRMSPGSPQEIPGFMSLKNYRKENKTGAVECNGQRDGESDNLVATWSEAPRGGFDNYTLCVHCEDLKPPQAHHCRVCNRCVLEMDHHCPFVNNCIGTSNLRHFMLFLLYASVACFYTMTAGIWSLWYNRAIFMGRSHRYPVSSQFFGGWMMTLVDMIAEAVINPSKRWMIAVLYVTFVSFGVALGVGVLFSMQMQQLLAGVSYIDSLKGGTQIGYQTGTSRMQNLQKVFGTGHVATWLLPRMSHPAGAASLQHVIKKAD